MVKGGNGVFEIRRLRPEDMPEVIEIERVCFSDAWEVDGFRGLVNNDQFDCFGYFDKGLCGYVIDYFVAGELHILNIAVKPEKRREGIAQKLFDFAMAFYLKELDLVFLEVRAGNVPAISFYLKQGFKQVGLRKNYYPDGEDAVLMTMMVRKLEG